MRQTSIAAPRPPEIRAEVRVRDRVMTYGRAGAGLPVVLLGVPSEPDAFWPELPDAIASGFRLVVPVLPGCDEDLAAWLADFLEGLGSTRVRIVAASGFCLPALELALTDLDRIERLVLVAAHRSGERLHGTLETASHRSVVPLLVVRRGLPAEDAIPQVLRFFQPEQNDAEERLSY